MAKFYGFILFRLVFFYIARAKTSNLGPHFFNKNSIFFLLCEEIKAPLLLIDESGCHGLNH